LVSTGNYNFLSAQCKFFIIIIKIIVIRGYKLYNVITNDTRRDKIRNETIRRNLGVPPLRIKIEESQLRLAGHVLRMGGDRIARKVFEAKAQGGRPVGRPRQT
jgi:hypothetical protein